MHLEINLNDGVMLESFGGEAAVRPEAEGPAKIQVSRASLGVGLFVLQLLLRFYGYTLAHGRSPARGRIRAAAACRCHSHSNTGSEPHV